MEIIAELAADPSSHVGQNLCPACSIGQQDAKEDRRIAAPVMAYRVSNPDNLTWEALCDVLHLLIEIFQLRDHRNLSTKEYSGDPV